ncbi:MAG: hypothetical protein QW734_11555 [Candidatus Bathyarchaeia archaeon]
MLKLFKLIFEIIMRLFRKSNEREDEKKEVEEKYTRDDFIKAVNELSERVEWRAKILKVALDKLREKYSGAHTEWVERDKITFQEIHRVLGCGLSFSFGKGIYAIPKDTFLSLIKDLEQNLIVWREEESDCDNIATAFKGFADYVIGKPIVIYTTGLVFRSAEQFGQRVCVCKSEYLLGGHAWNRVVILEPIEYTKIGTNDVVRDDFTVVNYEPQNDRVFVDVFEDGACYKTGGGLPIIYAGEKK